MQTLRIARVRSALPAAVLGLCACAATESRPAEAESELQSLHRMPGSTHPEDSRTEGPGWQPGTLVLQGYFGAANLDSVALLQGSSSVEIDAEEFGEFPVLGGGGQWKLWGEGLDLGLELLFSFGWRTNAIAFSSAGGGATVAIDVDTLLFDVFGGPFVSVFLGRSLRVYAAVGPMMQFVDYTQEDLNGEPVEGFGSGFGGYARAGFEFLLPSGAMLGFGVRRSSADVALGSDLGNFEVDSTQAVITVTAGF